MDRSCEDLTFKCDRPIVDIIFKKWDMHLKYNESQPHMKHSNVYLVS